MTELPGTVWRGEPFTAAEAAGFAPMPAVWRDIGEVRHGLTHFELRLRVHAAEVDCIEAEGFLRRITELQGEALPSVMSKCVALACARRRV